jgi:uncharacterized membrane protein YhiD involved in acid resistance
MIELVFGLVIGFVFGFAVGWDSADRAEAAGISL